MSLFRDKVSKEPVRFLLHKSINKRHQRDRLTQRIEENGGIVISKLYKAETVLVDKNRCNRQALQISYDADTDPRLHKIYVEHMAFIEHCIAKQHFSHRISDIKPMPGIPPKKIRENFTEEDDRHLCIYLARIMPVKESGGRFGLNVYKQLVDAAKERPDAYGWAARHPPESWKQRYKINAERFDPVIEEIARREPPLQKQLWRQSRSKNRHAVRGIDSGEEEEDEQEQYEEEQEQEMREQEQEVEEQEQEMREQEQELEEQEQEVEEQEQEVEDEEFAKFQQAIPRVVMKRKRSAERVLRDSQSPANRRQSSTPLQTQRINNKGKERVIEFPDEISEVQHKSTGNGDQDLYESLFTSELFLRAVNEDNFAPGVIEHEPYIESEFSAENNGLLTPSPTKPPLPRTRLDTNLQPGKQVASPRPLSPPQIQTRKTASSLLQNPSLASQQQPRKAARRPRGMLQQIAAGETAYKNTLSVEPPSPSPLPRLRKRQKLSPTQDIVVEDAARLVSHSPIPQLGESLADEKDVEDLLIADEQSVVQSDKHLRTLSMDTDDAQIMNHFQGISFVPQPPMWDFGSLKPSEVLKRYESTSSLRSNFSMSPIPVKFPTGRIEPTIALNKTFNSNYKIPEPRTPPRRRRGSMSSSDSFPYLGTRASTLKKSLQQREKITPYKPPEGTRAAQHAKSR